MQRNLPSVKSQLSRIKLERNRLFIKPIINKIQIRKQEYRMVTSEAITSQYTKGVTGFLANFKIRWYNEFKETIYEKKLVELKDEVYKKLFKKTEEEEEKY